MSRIAHSESPRLAITDLVPVCTTPAFAGEGGTAMRPPRPGAWRLGLSAACGLVVVSAASDAQIFGGMLLLAFAWLGWRQTRAAHAELEQARSARDAAVEALERNLRHVAMARHDLQQPVYALGLLADAIAARTRDPALQPTVVQLRRVMASMRTLCDTVLDPSRIDSGGEPLALQAAELHLLLAEVLSAFDDAASGRGLSLRARAAMVGVRAGADPALLKRALSNLIQNAVRYTEHGGVLVAMRRRAGQLRFEVYDTGVGVAPEDLQRIFAPYQRAPQAVCLHAAGQGLGLAIVARCADLMGGSCGVRSVPGRGSCFWLSLPAASGAPKLNAPLVHRPGPGRPVWPRFGPAGQNA